LSENAVLKVFKIEVERETGSLERVLSVARRRGLVLERLSVIADGPSLYQIRMETGGVPAEAALALVQLNALIDVKRAVMED
jgi:acetolactate synthase small subunit